MDELPARLTAFWSNFHYPVGFGNNVGMVLDNHHGVALVDQRVQEFDEATTIGLVQSDGGFFQEVQVRTNLSARALPEGG